MNDNEVNKIIAEFYYDGHEFEMIFEGLIYFVDVSEFQQPLYTKSLDALVPVFDKLEIPRHPLE